MLKFSGGKPGWMNSTLRLITLKKKENVIADGLSRLSSGESNTEVVINLHELFDEEPNAIHSAESYVRIIEQPINLFKNKIFIKITLLILLKRK